MLYLRGLLPPAPTLSIVGSRRPTARGRESARSLAAGAAAAGACVVSGLAYGIDCASHAGAIAAGGCTLAVLASGLDRATPVGNQRLAQRILEQGGGWLSEYPPGVPARAHHFPARNRLISGLSRATLVVEAREKSGSLWTARHALDQNRDVLVVPGPIDSEHCLGTNRLLRDGATPVLDCDDLLRAALPMLASRPRGGSGLGLELDEARILDELRRGGPRYADALAAALGLRPAELAGRLLGLELRSLVIREGSRVSLGPALGPGARGAGR